MRADARRPSEGRMGHGGGGPSAPRRGKNPTAGAQGRRGAGGDAGPAVPGHPQPSAGAPCPPPAPLAPAANKRNAKRRRSPGKKERKQEAEGGASASGGEGRRLPEDPAELASVKISTAVPRAQNKHIGNACSLRNRAALPAPSRARCLCSPARPRAERVLVKVLAGASQPPARFSKWHPAGPEASQTNHRLSFTSVAENEPKNKRLEF